MSRRPTQKRHAPRRHSKKQLHKPETHLLMLLALLCALVSLTLDPRQDQALVGHATEVLALNETVERPTNALTIGKNSPIAFTQEGDLQAVVVYENMGNLTPSSASELLIYSSNSQPRSLIAVFNQDTGEVSLKGRVFPSRTGITPNDLVDETIIKNIDGEVIALVQDPGNLILRGEITLP